MATKQTPTVPTSEAGETADNAKLPKKEAVRQQRITQVRGLMPIEQTPTVPTPNAGEMANNTKLHN
ncbi:hypothetical protein C4K03_4723 [Pseudomonas synxantha]|uniref:Uncharacterized protein n=1 Tax=Pseudomonas synxantha TaxID=47883 RepID=A0A3G7UCC4_9PSED|nr:hypothetical protein [Pseudomonas synxantha]AZE56861.1 hypothetical protein C4K03_4723 [Pseudomonas synxantha]